MSVSFILLLAGAVFALAYRTYGRMLARHVKLDAARATPAVEIDDGVDFVPAEKKFLLGQHFSAIAAAGPIVGPILAGLAFGWLPALIWIVAGNIFFGSVHDFAALTGSVRHRARTIVEMSQQYLGRTGHVLFLIFVWMSLLYVITAFTDLTASAFVDPQLGGATASSSLSYLLIGLLMGLALKFRMPLKWATPFFLLLVLASIALGPILPLVLPAAAGDPRQAWNVLLLAYCFIASLVPVWLLLQPRGYLGGFFLYGTLAAGLAGAVIGGEAVRYPAYLGLVSEKGMPLFPLLFVTIACGACSGFHGIVCSGTTSKQISKETDCHLVGYGGMLLEGIVAVLALATIMIVPRGDALAGASPDRIYAEGLSRFVSHLGIPIGYARSFALLAFATFIYDTLDVATRLARQIFEELTGLKGAFGRLIATTASLAVPLVCVSWKAVDAAGRAVPAWKIFWTVFGTSNQLLAALTLMVLAVWFKREGRNWKLVALPMVFMMGVTFTSLAMLAAPAFKGGAKEPTSFVAAALLVVGALLVAQAAGSLGGERGILKMFSKTKGTPKT